MGGFRKGDFHIRSKKIQCAKNKNCAKNYKLYIFKKSLDPSKFKGLFAKIYVKVLCRNCAIRFLIF